MKVSQMPNLSLMDMKQGQEDIDISMEVDLLNLLGKLLSAKDRKNINLIVVSVSFLSLKF